LTRFYQCDILLSQWLFISLSFTFRSITMKQDFQTTRLVGWRAVILRLTKSGLELVAPSQCRAIEHSDNMLFPDRPPELDNHHGLHFWAFDFLVPVRPEAVIRRHGAAELLVAARVHVPPSHYAVVSENGVGRASALAVDELLCPAELLRADLYCPALRRAYEAATADGWPVTIAPPDAPIVLGPSDFCFGDADVVIRVYPTHWARGGQWWYHHEEDCWRELRHTLTKHGII
jgi:hypothetical protein